MSVVSKSAQPSPIKLSDGQYRIDGTVKLKATPANTPLRRRVRLHNQRTGALVRETWSDSTTGTYSFAAIKAGLYYVVSFDHTNTHAAVIADKLQAARMV
jgi:hypothetical protein